MALKKIVPTSPSKNLLKEVDMTPLKVGDWNNDLKGQIAAEVSTNASAIALKADINDPKFTGLVTLPDLTPINPLLPPVGAAGNEYLVVGNLGIILGLPTPSEGARITVLITKKVTSGNHLIGVSAGTTISGYALLNSHIAGGDAISYFAAAGSTAITLNGTTTGGLVGDKIEFVGISDTEWRVRAELGHSGTAATPFS
tara:strand:+ start:518 stop:1114 length:597 start_codon:yes stop_codon:yes gene_type:complete